MIVIAEEQGENEHSQVNGQTYPEGHDPRDAVHPSLKVVCYTVGGQV